MVIRPHSIIAIGLAAARLASAYTTSFIEPEPRPISRYETGWEKNPFTLKITPFAPSPESFAKDIALAGWRQAEEDTIVTLVNTKTRVYTRLKNNEPGPDGIRVKAAHVEGRQVDMFVELEKDKKTPVVVRFDDGFIRTMGAQVGVPKAGGNPQLPGRALAPQAAPAITTAPVTMVPNITGQSAPRPPTDVPTVPHPQLPQSGLSPGNNIPTIQRRRLNTAPQPQLPPR